MKVNNEIQKEWESIGADFGIHNGLPLFSIPENYFEALPDQILASVKAASGTDLPLEKYSNPFAVPDNYFEQLDVQIMQSVLTAQKKIESTTIEGLSKDNVFAVPENYFEQFEESVWAAIYSEEDVDLELNESPLLASLKGANPFEMPTTMPQIDIAAITQPNVIEDAEPGTVTVPMKVRRSLRWSNIAAAASVALFFVLGASWLHFNKSTSNVGEALSSKSTISVDPQMVASEKLAQVSDEAIDEYLDSHVDEFSEYMLESNAKVSAPVADSKQGGNALDNISDEAIDEYLNNGVY